MDKAQLSEAALNEKRPDAPRGMKPLFNCLNRQLKSRDAGGAGGRLSGDQASLI